MLKKIIFVLSAVIIMVCAVFAIRGNFELDYLCRFWYMWVIGWIACVGLSMTVPKRWSAGVLISNLYNKNRR